MAFLSNCQSVEPGWGACLGAIEGPAVDRLLQGALRAGTPALAVLDHNFDQPLSEETVRQTDRCDLASSWLVHYLPDVL